MKTKVLIIVLGAVSIGAALCLWRDDPGATSRVELTSTPAAPDAAPVPEAILNTGKANAPVGQPETAPVDPVPPKPIEFGPNINFVSTFQQIKEHESTLSAADRDSLYVFLMAKDMPSGFNENQYFALKNEILNILRNCVPPSNKIEDAMLELYEDHGHPAAIRDYAIQHLSLWYENGYGNLDKGGDIIRKALAETDSTIAGTALLAANRLVGRLPGLDQQFVKKSACDIALDESASELSRITALQVGALYGAEELLPAIEEILAGHGNGPLAISAVAALGTVSGSDALERLQQISSEGDLRLRPAAESALRRIAARN